jgi:hypothetical protein
MGLGSNYMKIKNKLGRFEQRSFVWKLVASSRAEPSLEISTFSITTEYNAKHFDLKNLE